MASSVKHFDLLNYIIFFGILIISGLIGIYYSFFTKIKPNTINEYFFGGRKMMVFPISMSIIATFLTGSMIIAVPTEVYLYGAQVWMNAVTAVLANIIATYLFLPVYFNLRLSSVFEYLKLRYNTKIEKLALVLYLIKQLLISPIIIYAPASAFSRVSGINIYLIAMVTYSICVLCTVLGGLRGVVWVDTFQAIVVLLSLILICIFGTREAGGFQTTWNRNSLTDRIEFFNLDLDPTRRYTFWNILFGKVVLCTCLFAVDQGTVQRYVALPTIDKAKKSILITGVSVFGIVIMLCFIGLIMYSTYFDCDPITVQKMKNDQILSYFIMRIEERIPGLGGLFISCLFSASLSTMSTWLNSMACVLYIDLLKPTILKNVSEERTSIIVKILTLLISIVCFCSIFIVENLGTIMQTFITFMAIPGSPLLGLFCLGLFLPWTNSKGAFVGVIAGFLFPAWIFIKSHIAQKQGFLKATTKLLSTDGCEEKWTFKTNFTEVNERQIQEVFFLYRISFCYYSVIGLTTTIIIGVIVSYLTGFNDLAKVDRNLLSPIIQKYFKQRHENKIDDALENNREELKPLNLEENHN